ncbi:hypothetical protein [endosymbiont GvMRE of Glomus versiforme]|uniref:hypothetical protein n=1 Tax=endosymbiont GvMRE of Glomus versiforme TaxID=2039283 RepID=UPI000ED9E71B|nr:hypothetical protein [endosymbiont GvMRE of Glomus versiforme]RHZ35551.1 hypothetical protein GvMRE_IIg21 [endosymbiont GvMRE of Glomus versiforme]
MTTTNEIKEQLGKHTEQLESYLEPWQRGTLIIVLTTFLLVSIYLLTKKETPEPRELTEIERKKLEALIEERILKRAEFLKKLQNNHVWK